MIKFALYISILAISLSACSLLPDRDEPVARVGDRQLTMKELSGYVPDYLDATDSALWADDYVKKWVQRELLLLKAEENLKPEMKDVTKELEEYRNSLLVYRYKNELVHEKMDTTVTDTNIQKYFDEHRESFILNRNIVKAVYIKIPVQVSNPENIKDLCLCRKTRIARLKLNAYCMSYAKTFDRFNDQWIAADMVFFEYTSAEEVKDQT